MATRPALLGRPGATPAAFGAPSGDVPVVTRVAPHVRDALDLRGVTNRVVLALLPCLLAGLYNTGYQANLALELFDADAATWRVAALEAIGLDPDPDDAWAAIAHGTLYLLPIFAVALVVGGLWQGLFARLRGREPAEGLVVTALVFSLILPPAAPLWQVALGISFGVVIGKEIFGGTGKNFLNPALVGLVFLYLAYPRATAGEVLWTGVSGYGGTTLFAAVAGSGMDALEQWDVTWSQSFLGLIQGTIGETSTLACLIGAAVLLVSRVASWRVMAAVLVGMVGTASLLNLAADGTAPLLEMPWYWHLTLGGFAFGTVFLATDPVSGAMTDSGRWAYGLLIGFMVVLVRVANPAHPDGVMLAILLGNIFAPLIDYGVVWANVRRRRRRAARRGS